MKRRRLMAIVTVSFSVVATVLISEGMLVSARNGGDTDGPLPLYNPYPPGILPADLTSEIARVLREIDVIENRAIERWRALPPPTLFGVRPGPNPPVFKGTGTESVETLGAASENNQKFAARRIGPQSATQRPQSHIRGTAVQHEKARAILQFQCLGFTCRVWQENLGKDLVNRERLFNVEGAKEMRTNHLKGESHLGLRPLVTKNAFQ
jgi:hypothetical protein